MADEKNETLRFEEGVNQFVGFDKDSGDFSDLSRVIVTVYLNDEEIGYIDQDGSVTFRGDTIADEPTTIMSWGITLTPEQRKRIDIAADKFQRKCDIKAIIVACEQALTLKQFSEVRDPPRELPRTFREGGNGEIDILKGEYLIGVIRTSKTEIVRLVILSQVKRIGLTEADKAAIIEKCREIVVSQKIE